MQDQIINVKEHMAKLESDMQNVVTTLNEMKVQSNERNRLLDKIDKSTDNTLFRVCNLERRVEELDAVADDYRFNKWRIYGGITVLAMLASVASQFVFKIL